jgi:hypothetical protein
MEIILSEAQEAAIIREYGTPKYLQTYCEMLANHLIQKQADDDRVKKVDTILKAEALEDEYLAAKAKLDAIEAAKNAGE